MLSLICPQKDEQGALANENGRPLYLAAILANVVIYHRSCLRVSINN